MDTATIALFISMLSALIAGLSLGWNIYRDAFQRPKLKIKFSMSSIVNEQGMQFTAPCLEAINFGPGPVKVQMTYVKKKSLFKKDIYGAVQHDYKNPYSDRLPKRLEPGESVTLFMPYSEKADFLKAKYTHIGITDTFGRLHCSTRKEYKCVRRKWLQEFGNR